MRSGYRSAAVCRRGHEITSSIEFRGEVELHCPDCGAKVLTACTACGDRIQGSYHSPVVLTGTRYEAPDFCDRCGAPHPWASRQARLWAIENLLDDEDLSDADRLELHERFDELRAGEVDEKRQIEIWKHIKNKVPGLLSIAGRIIESVTTEAMKAQLGS